MTPEQKRFFEENPDYAPFYCSTGLIIAVKGLPTCEKRKPIWIEPDQRIDLTPPSTRT